MSIDNFRGCTTSHRFSTTTDAGAAGKELSGYQGDTHDESCREFVKFHF